LIKFLFKLYYFANVSQVYLKQKINQNFLFSHDQVLRNDREVLYLREEVNHWRDLTQDTMETFYRYCQKM